MSTEYDSPWKEALDAYFEPFLVPQVHREIDWSRGYESLDKEFQQAAYLKALSITGRVTILSFDQAMISRIGLP